MSNKTQAKTYFLRGKNGQLLGQVVLTSDGMFAAVTDYGNLSYAWRSTGCADFREFICRLDIEYFANKLRIGNSHITSFNHEQCLIFAEKILPALQKALTEELKNGINW